MLFKFRLQDGSYVTHDSVAAATVTLRTAGRLAPTSMKASGLRGLALPDDFGVALAACTSLETVDMHNCGIGDSSLLYVVRLLAAEGSQLSRLNLAANNVGAGGAARLAAALRNNGSLVSLNLFNNQLGNDGTRPLLEALEENKSLTTLYLGRNGIREAGGRCIARLLRRNATISTLAMTQNRLGNEGISAICQSLIGNKTLTNLYLAYNAIGDAGTICLASALKYNTTLTSLKLDNNKITDKGAASLISLITKNHTLTSMSLAKNRTVSAGSMAAIEQALGRNAAAAALSEEGAPKPFRLGTAALPAKLEPLPKHFKFGPITTPPKPFQFGQITPPQPFQFGVPASPQQPHPPLVDEPRPQAPVKSHVESLLVARQRYAEEGFGTLDQDMSVESTVAAVLKERTGLLAAQTEVEAVDEACQRVVAAQRAVVESRGEDESVMLARDEAIGAFMVVSTRLEAVRTSVEAVHLPLLVVDDEDDEGEEEDPSVAKMSYDDLGSFAAELETWVAATQEVSDKWEDEVDTARERFVSAHHQLANAMLGDDLAAMFAAEAECRRCATAVDTLVSRKPVVPPSPLAHVSPARPRAVLGAMRDWRVKIVSQITSGLHARNELLAHGDTCPSTVAYEAAQLAFKKAARAVKRLELEHAEVLEDGEDVGEIVTLLERAAEERRTTARAVDEAALRLSLASARWPELQFRTGRDGITNVRSLHVFDDHTVLAPGPPTSRFRVIRGTAPDGERVALKLFPLSASSDDKVTRRFIREAQRLQQLKFDHVVRVRDVFVHNEGGARFGVVEIQYYGHGDMQQWLANAEPSPLPSQVRSVLRDALLGLGFCHGVGIVHGDVKPANIFVGENGTAVLGDFDVSHDEGMRLTTTLVLGATVDFMAPELKVIGARATKASDVYAFGQTIGHVRDRLDVDVSSLIARCSGDEPTDRCTAEEALADDFFRGAACRADDWTSVECIIMAHCGGEAQHAASGVHCPSGHFVCTGDLEALIANRAETADEVHCPDPSCGTREYNAAALTRAVSADAFTTWMRGKERRIASKLSVEMEAQYRAQLSAKLAEYSADDGNVLRHADAVIERFINIACPRCHAVFVDFSGCAALVCSVSTCKAAFCAWCLMDCGSDAHQHVPRCFANPARTDPDADPFYTSDARWKAAMTRRTNRLVKRYLENDVHDNELRRKVVDRLAAMTGTVYG